MAGVDYSKWDKFTDEDEPASKADSSDSKVDKQAAASAPKKAKKTMICSNCRAEGAKLRCTICKKVAYCNRNCQKSDWRFHKRICKKPEKKKKKDEKPKAKDAKKGSSSSSSSTSSSGGSSAAAAPAGSSKPSRPKKKAQASAPTQAEMDAEDEAIVKSLKGYRYFHRDVSEEEAKIIGDTTPELMRASDVDSDDPQPMAAATSTPSSLASASAWNSARTFEERDMTRWAKSHLESLLIGIAHDIAGGTAVVHELSDWEGDASIPVIRGRARFLYDFTFKVKVNIKAAGDSAAKKAEIKIVDFSQDDEDAEFRVSFASPKPTALHQAAFRSVMEAGSGELRAKITAALDQFVTDFKAK